MADLIKAEVWLLGKCSLCGTPIDHIEREGTTVWHFHVAPDQPASGMPHTPAQGALADSFVSTDEAAANLTGTAHQGMPRPPAETNGDGLAVEKRGTGERKAHGGAEAVERGRQIAVSMMDRAEAKHRHANRTPHLREHCETCAEEYWRDRLRPVHYTEAAQSLRNLGHTAAAERLESYVRDLDEEAGR